MSRNDDRGRMDWLVELAGAAVPALAVGYAVRQLAPSLGWPMPESLIGSALTAFALAFAVIRIVPPEPRRAELPAFALAEVIEEPLLLDLMVRDQPEELLLDQPLVETVSEAVAILLLEDVLPAPDPGSRVVQLFAGGRMPTAGQLQQRIERHLADGVGRDPAVMSDATDVLGEALAELRRSLRQG